MSEYSSQNFKIPIESVDYPQASAYVTKAIEEIIENAIKNGKTKSYLIPIFEKVFQWKISIKLQDR